MTMVREIKKVLVVGAGTMGAGIAQVAAAAGWTVRVHDVDPTRAEGAVTRARAGFERTVAKGKMTREAAGAASGRLAAAEDLAAAGADADLAIEAVPEDLELKRRIFERLDAALPAGALLATNTSSLPVGRIAEATRRPEAVAGMHFFNPVPLMPLVEIVRGARTAEPVIAALRDAAARMGKQTIVVRDSPGFATSRLGIALGLEAMRMLEEGVASAGDIDRAMELGYGHPMGPLKLTDLVGLDVRLAIAEHLAREVDAERFRPPEILKRTVAEGRLGKKTGRGFHEWPETS